MIIERRWVWCDRIRIRDSIKGGGGLFQDSPAMEAKVMKKRTRQKGKKQKRSWGT